MKTDEKNKSNKTNDQQNQEDQKEKDFWQEAKENVTEGARAVGETVGDYAETIKEKAGEAFKLSSAFTMDMVHKAQDIIDEFREKQEIKHLSDARDEFMAQAGMALYRAVKENDHKLPDGFIDEKSVAAMLKEIETIDAKIIEIEKHLDKS